MTYRNARLTPVTRAELVVRRVALWGFNVRQSDFHDARPGAHRPTGSTALRGAHRRQDCCERYQVILSRARRLVAGHDGPCERR